jgi:hypothetical protein
MDQINILKTVINKALEKGVFSNCNDIAIVLQALQNLQNKIETFENGDNSTNN